MSKVSKTARASMGGGPVVAKSIIPDAELIRLLRIDRNSGIFPGTQGTDALLRAYDEAMLKGQQNYDSAKLLDEVASGLRAELYVANQEIEKLKAINAELVADNEPVGGTAVEGAGVYLIPPGGNGPDGKINESTVFEVVPATEPGLHPLTQALDSIEYARAHGMSPANDAVQEHGDVMRAIGHAPEGDGQEHSDVMRAIGY